MEIILTASIDLEIRDLGIILKNTESINMLENFDVDEMIQSNDLQSSQSDYDITIDLESVTYDVFIERITKLTKHDHNDLNVLQHNIYDNNYFMVTKTNGTTKYITYYTDDTMTNKLQEDEIVRNQSGKVGEIITRKFNGDGSIYQELRQVLNRSIEGKVESISTNTL